MPLNTCTVAGWVNLYSPPSFPRTPPQVGSNQQLCFSERKHPHREKSEIPGSVHQLVNQKCNSLCLLLVFTLLLSSQASFQHWIFVVSYFQTLTSEIYHERAAPAQKTSELAGPARVSWLRIECALFHQQRHEPSLGLCWFVWSSVWLRSSELGTALSA